ncbi:MBL fold metallo-hydrolase [Gorillibacterium sp. CAU 1737]|uniref:MBL fold metallo-hydrolase n=1 Tax=Gorillibacterium sp. CAU 1737 TaxID=3140362 RepID=UPI0032607E71
MNPTVPTIQPLDLGGVNSYLLRTENGFILVDTGGHLVLDKVFDNRREKLLQALASAGCVKGTLRLILLTHGDVDHAGNAAFLSRTLDAPIAMHPGDLELVSAPTLDLFMASYHYQSFMLRTVFRMMRKKILLVTQKTLDDFEPFQPDILLEDGMSLKSYGLDGTILHLPGHTDGSVGLLLADGSLLVGDLLANNKKPAPAPNANDFTELAKSIKKLSLYPIENVYPGHGRPFSLKEFAGTSSNAS